MKIVTINELGDYDGQNVQLRGWVYNTRSIGKIWFLIFRDGTGLLQCVVAKDEATDESFAMEQTLNQEDSIIFNRASIERGLEDHQGDRASPWSV